MADDKKGPDESVPFCSFCGADSSEGAILVKGDSDCHICAQCIKESSEIVAEWNGKKARSDGLLKHTPSSIVAHLDKYVVGQADAKRKVAVAVYGHLKRINGLDTGGVSIQKSNLLMVGSTGSGKSFMIQVLAKLLRMPLVIADATSLTAAGYVGDDVESILTRLIQAADGNVENAQKGICFIDEIDKISKASRSDGGRDIGGEAVQQALLKIVEGSMVAVNPTGIKKTASSDTVWIDTTNILFIGGGAFSSMRDSRDRKSMGIGSSNNTKPKDRSFKHSELTKAGIIPELAGRLPVIATLKDLTTDDLVKILSNTKDCLTDQYKSMLRMDSVQMHFSPEFLERVANEAKAEGTGARALRTIMEGYLQEVMFKGPELAGKRVTIQGDGTWTEEPCQTKEQREV